MTGRRPPGPLVLWILGMLAAASFCTPPADSAVTGDESLEQGQTYYRVYDMREGDRLIWEWRTVTPYGNLTCSLSRMGNIINQTRGGSGSGEYLAEINCPVVLEWANYWPNETAFHFWVDRELLPARYYPYYAALAVAIVVPAMLIVLVISGNRKD